MSHFMTTSVRLHEREGTLEVNRQTFRSCLEVIKSKHEVICENCVIPESPSAFVYCLKGMRQPFAVAVYPRSKPTQYFILMDKISNDLLEKIKKVETADVKFQDQLKSYVRPARRGNFTTSEKLRKTSSSGVGNAVKRPLRGKRIFRLGQGRYGDIRKAPIEK